MAKTARGGDPHSAVSVLKKRIWEIVGFHTLVVPTDRIDIDLPVLPAVQAATSTDPYGSIPTSQDSANDSTRQALLLRECCYGEVAKAVKSINGSCPDILFTILKESINGITRKALRLCKYVYSSLVYMH